ncbi:tRNA-specific adenosine deaminase [Oceanibacterium hippocampi]|uniref:tRNA-specific adenosine deaminase n=1 Tax=Oceanibacterium hippocampi TaxID=745714 RepID=A0A1Y5S7P2_9PROT|nr:tRNA-specific adenosine deaminase [Oceanibacterium hippocampi]
MPDYMQEAFAAAEMAGRRGEVPIGAVVVHSGLQRIVGRAGNEVEDRGDATAHAEMLAIRGASRMLGQKFLSECDLYVTLEPCPMCAQAIAFARIRRLYFAAFDPKGGGVENGPRIFEQPTCHHRLECYGGIQEMRSAELLRDFFAARR